MNESISGIILAGGQNKRFNGKNKAFVEINGKPIIRHIIDAISPLCDPLIIVTNTPERYTDFDALIVSDLFPYRSSLSGIHAGLFNMPTPYGFFTACDTPFIDPYLVTFLIRQIQRRRDAIVPKTLLGFEPLFALYAKRCLEAVEPQILKKDFKIQNFYRYIKVTFIEELQLRRIDPDLKSFLNINSPFELDKVQKRTKL